MEVCAFGAMTRQRAGKEYISRRARALLLHATMPYIADTQIRNRGTIGGSFGPRRPRLSCR